MSMGPTRKGPFVTFDGRRWYRTGDLGMVVTHNRDGGEDPWLVNVFASGVMESFGFESEEARDVALLEFMSLFDDD